MKAQKPIGKTTRFIVRVITQEGETLDTEHTTISEAQEEAEFSEDDTYFVTVCLVREMKTVDGLKEHIEHWYKGKPT